MILIIRIFIFAIAISSSYNLLAQKYDAELVNHETKIFIKKNKLYKIVFYEIRVNNRAGDKYAEVAIPYSQMNKLSNINAFLKDRNGVTVKKLKKGDIEERSAISNYSFYEDDFVKEFTLRHNTYPYTIYYSYEIEQEEFIFIDYWLPVLDDKVPTLKAKLFIELPNEYNISYTEQLVKNVKVVPTGLNTQYTWVI